MSHPIRAGPTEIRFEIVRIEFGPRRIEFAFDSATHRKNPESKQFPFTIGLTSFDVQ